MNRLHVTTTQQGDVVCIALVGELDLAGAAEAEHALYELEEQHPDSILLDLRGLTFLDSTGLRLLLRADARARSEGRRLAVVPGPESVQRVFRITRLDRRLEFVHDPLELD